ncbi:Protein kinase-like domain protein [Metarhizium album ARSEF 1941]|uniref:cyclin-dependent kinase n=1 Tax=Metarhizium album (strain ARSEF 1941) TaxID=1081103 RepID=A0A0B2WWH1_METAS|nr:Protein kinase-like domain protein [Metarhizium album ARSEF 1941]KHN98413.1 Protein kinase-like domain protein [Metarhizium album ARSEF 1941]
MVKAASRNPADTDPPASETGIRIGKYNNCTLIADGVTSEVYRSDKHVLKVIVQHNIEPHDPKREAAILQELHSLIPSAEQIINLTETFRDREQRFVLVFPYIPMTLGHVISSGSIPLHHTRSIFRDIISGLAFIHRHAIIHRDIKPSAILLQSPSGPSCISDFGTAWHPRLSSYTEPQDDKILDIGTGAYRAPEVLFGNKGYGTSVDMWALGVMLAEVVSTPPVPPFESRPAHEDGNQLGLILSIFKTMGTPTPDTWPEAKGFKVTPFELWTVFPQRDWADILPAVDGEFRDLVSRLVCFESSRRDGAEEVSDTS